MNEFTIRDIENLSGIKAHTIRIWEQRYSFLKPRRTKTNIRYYRSEELKTILNIALLNKYGFKISHINNMTDEMIREKIFSLTHAEALQERMLNDLLHCMVDLDVDTFEQTLDQYIYNNGIDKCINHLIFPFLDRIGILWITNHIKVAQEHLVTNIIRQKFIMGIQNVTQLQKASKTIVLFLPEGEHHELGLLYVHYLLKIRGISVLYLGADVPVDDLEFVCRIRKPQYIYSHLTSVPPRLNFEKYLTDICNRLKDIPLVLSGRLAQNYHRKIPSGISVKQNIADVLSHLAH